MAVLENIKHEKFVQAVITSPTYTEAYQKVYKCERDSARSSAPVVLANPSVKNRLLEVMEQNGIDEDRITAKLNELLDNPKGSVQLGTVRTVLEVRKDIDSANKIGIQVNINQEERSKVVSRLNKYQSLMTRKTQPSKSSNDINDSKNKAK